jgi:hypothetical protein
MFLSGACVSFASLTAEAELPRSDRPLSAELTGLRIPLPIRVLGDRRTDRGIVVPPAIEAPTVLPVRDGKPMTAWTSRHAGRLGRITRKHNTLSYLSKTT